MPRLVALSLLSLGLLPLAGCEPGPALLRVSEVLIEFDDGSNTLREELEYSYNSASQLEEIERTREGDLVVRYEYAYDSQARMIEAERTAPNEARLTFDFEYEGDLLVEYEGSVDGERHRYELEYFENDPSFLKELIFTLDTETYNGTSELIYSYNSDSQLSKIDRRIVVKGKGAQAGNESKSSQLTKLRWDEEGRLSRITVEDESTSGERSSEEIKFAYHANGAVKSADGDEGSRVRVKYDAEDRIREIEAISNGRTAVYEYTYEEGRTDGFVITPFLPGSFDLMGKSQARIAPYSDLIIPGP